jgi:hypothetical protein
MGLAAATATSSIAPTPHVSEVDELAEKGVDAPAPAFSINAAQFNAVEVEKLLIAPRSV